MNSIEQKRTLAKLVLVISTTLLAVLLLVQFFPEIFSSSSVIGDSPSTTDLKTAYEQIQEKYKTSTEQIKVYNLTFRVSWVTKIEIAEKHIQ